MKPNASHRRAILHSFVLSMCLPGAITEYRDRLFGTDKRSIVADAMDMLCRFASANGVSVRALEYAVTE